MHTLYTFVSIMSRWTTHEHRRPLRSVKHETGTNLKPVCGCPLVANGNLDHICYRFRDSDENWNRRFLSYWRDSYSPVLRESFLGTGVLNLVPKKSRPWAPRLRAFLCHDSISEKTKTIVDFTHQKPLTGQGSK